jgi:PadR family transcriptional regulator PadR
MDDMDLTGEWLRGLLGTCALAVLARGSAHGYAVVQQLQAAGLGPIKGGALYPVLNRLERDGAVTAEWREGEGGPGRKVFTLTPAGLAHLASLRDGWGPFAQTVAGLLDTPGPPSPSSPLTSTGDLP